MKEIKGYTDYFVTRGGKVLSSRRGKEKELKAFSTPTGYLQVTLCSGAGQKKCYVHRLVADAFLFKEGGLEVNHKDGNKGNNSIENLEWITHKENITHGIVSGLITPRFSEAARKRSAETLSKSATLLSPEGIIVEIFNIRKFCREQGLNQSNLNKVCKGDSLHHKGWKLYSGNTDTSINATPLAKTYNFITPEGKQVSVYNLRNFCREENLDPSALVKLSKGKILSSKGYKLWHK